MDSANTTKYRSFQDQEIQSDVEHYQGINSKSSSMRLDDLEKTGFIKYIEDSKSPKVVQWMLTRKGIDTLPILMSFAVFGSKWNADQVFEDRKPRVLHELFPQNIIRKYMK